MTLTKHRKIMLERVLKIQLEHPQPETFEALIVWLNMKLEKQVKAKRKISQSIDAHAKNVRTQLE